MCRLHSFVRDLSGRRRVIVLFLAGGVSALALAPLFFWPVLFVTLPILVWSLDVAVLRDAPLEAEAQTAYGPLRFSPGRLRVAALQGWAFGFGYFLVGLFWVGEAFLVQPEKFAWLLPVALIGMPGGLALFYAGATAAAAVFWNSAFSRVLVLALTLSAFEWLRGNILTGFPWNVLGYALTYPLPLMQSVSVFGIYGLTFIAVILFAAPATIWVATPAQPVQTRRRLTLSALPALLIIIAYGAGHVRLALAEQELVEGVRFRLVQPSIPQREKWRPGKQLEIFNAHLRLSRHSAQGVKDDARGITHIVWPEVAMPFLPLREPHALKAIGDMLPPDVFLITGALRLETPTAKATGKRRLFNSMLVFDDAGRLVTRYDKAHLVPFGEYLPYQETMEWLGLRQLTGIIGGFTAGPPARPLLSVPGLPTAGPLICYEVIFPGAVVQSAQRPKFLLNVTNDAWFGHLNGPFQHFHQARVRAVEEGLPLVRVANNGVSAMIDAHGRLHGHLGLNAVGIIDAGLPKSLPPTIYARYGDLILVLMWVAVVGGWVFCRRIM